ncbi:hypothetical protein VE02_01056 [Pseudogymnoascus sp. 03VT05]|nr:hypothetical protein VE02_01056 [Pseudogymnoascus sp. 03VT05]
MDINKMDQGLLKRNPSLTPAEFSHHWYNIHGPLMHAPLSTSDPNLDISAWDGVAGMPPQEVLDAPSTPPKWKQDYYREVILVDEKRFLVSAALEHIFRVGPGTVEGERKVVIREGKAVVEVGEEMWRVWRECERRGEEE